MAKKIVMLGGRRAGKSSILASVLENLKELSVQDICTVTDGTRYVDWEPGTSLSDKRDELQMYIAYKKAGEEFVVDMNPNRGHASYRVEISRIESGKKIFTQFEFIDVPGEWMKPYGDKKDGSVSAPQNAAEAAGQATMQTAAVTKSNHDQLIDMIGESDVLIVSIDTPYLFASEAVNNAYNRIDDVNNLLLKLQMESELDKKLIIFCPVKCEKYFRGYTDEKEQYIDIHEVTKRTCEAYQTAINHYRHDSRVTMLVMPVKTAGGLEHTKLRNPGKYYADANAQVSVMVGVDEDVDKKSSLWCEDGKIVTRKNGDEIILPDASNLNDPEFEKWRVGIYPIPKAWYKVTGKYAPQYCEQLTYRILKFFLEKDILVKKAKDEPDAASGKGFWARLIAASIAAIMAFVREFKPTFDDVQLPVFQEILNKISSKGLIKEYPGYKEIKEEIEKEIEKENNQSLI